MNSESDYPKALRPGFSPINEWSAPDRFYENPSVDSKVVRWNPIDENGIIELPYVATLFDDLETYYHIPTVHSQYVITGEQKSPAAKHYNITADKTLMIVSDRIIDAVPADVALDQAADESIGREFDDLSVNMLRHIDDLLSNGGVFMKEVYHYSQFVYSPSAQEGNRLIFVDTEPLNPSMLPRKYQRMEGGTPVGLVASLAYISQDILRLETVTGTISNAHLKLREVLNIIDSAGSVEIEIAKQSIIMALERGNPESLEFILERDFDDESFGTTAIDSTINLAEYIKHRNGNQRLPYQPFKNH